MNAWGARVCDDGGTRFRIWAPDSDAVTLEIQGEAPLAMTAAGEGWFETFANVGDGARYRYRIGDMAVPDPASRAQDGGVDGWSVVVDADAYAWRAHDWRGRPWEEMVIEEIHVGLYGGFRGVAERLPGIAACGVTAVELMPVNAFAGTRNWGYDGVLPYAPAECYGSPDDLRALVDCAHDHGISVFLDVVYNHFGPAGNYLGAYASAFFHPEVKTPWGGAVAVDADPPRRFFIDNALMWLKDYRIDGLRFDAVHAIANDGFLDAMAAELRAAVDRPVHLVLENENNDAERLGDGKYDAQWNDDFHNVLHVMLTGETDAYYADFADRPEERLARCLSEGFIYQGEGSANHDGKPRGTPSAHLPPTAFVSFLQNHDQIGNRALGERLTLLTDDERLRAATLLLLLSPQIPLFFMGDGSGSRSPFLFFTDFHDELADAVREGRRGEFAKFAAFADPEKRVSIPDPNAAATYEKSRPADGQHAASWAALYRDLIAVRREHIVPRLKGARSDGAEVLAEGAVAAHWLMGDGARLTIVLNLGDTTVEVPSPPALAALGFPGLPLSAGAWLEHPSA
jgi:maltooligosyltrehalose trehalohydrolase